MNVVVASDIVDVLLLIITDVEICFRKMGNGCRHPFRIFFCVFVKQMSTSVSHFSETDLDIRLVIFFAFLQIGSRHSFIFFLFFFVRE